MNRSTDEYGFTRMNLFFELLQMALGMRDHLSRVPTAVEWEEMYDEGVRQAVASLMVSAIESLPAEQSPPIDIKYEWIGDLQACETQNKWLNAEARRLTEVFAAEGRRSAILKGQANALLYPNRLLRMPGDIDIWVEGGRKSVKELLDAVEIIDGGRKDCRKQAPEAFWSTAFRRCSDVATFRDDEHGGGAYAL